MDFACSSAIILGLAASVAAAATCASETANGLTLKGLEDFEAYNGAYVVGAAELRIAGRPTFWQMLKEQTCGAEPAPGPGLQPGDCTANSWTVLPNGSSNTTACLEACEAAHVNGCCRWRPTWTEEQRCTIGHGRTFYRQGIVDADGFLITRCTGRAFIFYCEAAQEWNLAPPSAWDVIDNGRCYDKEKKSYYHSVALGSEDLSAGFKKEWAWQSQRVAHYAERRASVELLCPDPKNTTKGGDKARASEYKAFRSASFDAQDTGISAGHRPTWVLGAAVAVFLATLRLQSVF